MGTDAEILTFILKKLNANELSIFDTTTQNGYLRFLENSFLYGFSFDMEN